MVVAEDAAASQPSYWIRPEKNKPDICEYDSGGNTVNKGAEHGENPKFITC